MKILLTGADGFTGRHFSRMALAQGHAVVALKADLLDREKLALEVRAVKPDAIVHLAAISFVAHEHGQAFYDVNLFGTLNLLDAVKAAAIAPKVLLPSSANVYGNSPHSPIAEDQPPAPVNHYAMSKLAMEFMARKYAAELPLFFTRPFNYIGPGQHSSFVVPKLVEHFALRKSVIELGRLDVQREFNDVRFVCTSYLGLLEHALPGEVYNICTGTTYSLIDLLALLEDITGCKMDVNVNPAFLRDNEIDRLCGNPGKLKTTLGELPVVDLGTTLTWMVNSFSSGETAI